MAGKQEKSTPKATTAKTARTRARTPRKPKATPISQAMIAERAYFIYQSGQGGSDVDNWLRAERELAA